MQSVSSETYYQIFHYSVEYSMTISWVTVVVNNVLQCILGRGGCMETKRVEINKTCIKALQRPHYLSTGSGPNWYLLPSVLYTDLCLKGFLEWWRTGVGMNDVTGLLVIAMHWWPKCLITFNLTSPAYSTLYTLMLCHLAINNICFICHLTSLALTGIY